MYIKRKNNDDHLINEAGNTIFENIYKDCQNEIKDIIITKLLNKIQEINKRNDILEKENKKLKDNLLYILKRILLNKEDFNNNKIILNKANHYIYQHKSNSSKNIETFNLDTDSTKEKNKPNYTILESSKTLKYNIELNSTFDSLSFNNVENEQIKEIKAKKYLNNLFRKNFGSYTNGTSNAYFINKDKPIYDELFPKTTKYNKYSSLYINTFSNYNNPKTINVMHGRYNSTDINKTINLENNDKKHFNKIFNKIKQLNMKVDKKTIKKKKLASVDDKINKKKCKYKSIINNKYKMNDKIYYNIETETNKSIKKNKFNHKFPYFCRSPYILNKI